MRLRLQLLLVTVFAAGLGASFAFADDGNGKQGDGDHGSKCTEVHVYGTVAAQTLTVTLDRDSKRLNLAAGSQVVLQLGGTGQTVRVNAEACSTTTGTTGSATTYQVKSAELKARKTTTTTTAQGTTTAP